MATAYHKLVPVCEAADPLYGRFAPDDWACTDQPLPAEPDGKLAFDLIPMNQERGFCYGEYCPIAARAIDEYRAFLHVFSHFRTAVVHSILSGQCPFSEDGKLLQELLHLRDTLPRLVATLRGALPGLAATCVVPSRSGPRQASDNWEVSKRLWEEKESFKHGNAHSGSW